jgi:chromate transporter
MQGFGGVLAVAQRELVERKRWLSREEFLELLSVGQVLPGPNVVNMSLMIGHRFFGLSGALAGLAGMLVVPLIVVLLLASVYGHFDSHPAVHGALRGMGAVSSGLVLATAIKLLGSLRSSALGVGAASVLGLAAATAVGLAHWPLWWVVVGLGSLSVALAWRRLAP